MKVGVMILMLFECIGIWVICFGVGVRVFSFILFSSISGCSLCLVMEVMIFGYRW